MPLKSSPKINQQAVDKLIDTNPGKFDKQSNPYRIANKEKMSPDDFVKIIKKSLKAKNIVVHPPKSGPNDSSKFSMFEFESEFCRLSICFVFMADGQWPTTPYCFGAVFRTWGHPLVFKLSQF